MESGHKGGGGGGVRALHSGKSTWLGAWELPFHRSESPHLDGQHRFSPPRPDTLEVEAPNSFAYFMCDCML